MKHRASRRVSAAYDRLSPALRELADRSFERLKRDPRHPSLRFKKVGRSWSARVGSRHRALAVEAGEDVV